MEFNVKSGSPEKQRTSCLVLPVYFSRKLSRSAEEIDKVSDGTLSSLLRRGDMDGKLGQIHVLHNVPGTLAERIMLVGCGKERELNERNLNKIIAAVCSGLGNTGATEVYSYLTELSIKGRDIGWKLRHMAIQINSNAYSFDQLKSQQEDSKKTPRKFVLNIPSRRELSLGEQALREADAINSAMNLTRDLGNLPGNICTPTYLAEQALQMAKLYRNFEVEVLNEEQMHELKMGSLLSVAAGSRQPARLIVMQYKGAEPDKKPVVLVGKGVTFDSGGISIKPGLAMDEMKYDMCGAASVYGAMSAAAELELPMNLVGIVPATENMPDGLATKPGDIVTSMSGQTIEILNTDAEGRLILCDALTYAGKFDPDYVIDLATLTGAVIVALGKIPTGVFGNHQPLVRKVLNAGHEMDDKVWELPLWDDYQDQLKSNFADMANIGGRDGGSITAACFLSRFTKEYRWVHLDIAGTAWVSGDKKGATGRPVPLLVQFLLEYSQNLEA